MQDSLVLDGQSFNCAPNPSSSAEHPPASQVIATDLSAEAQQKIEVLQSLIEPCDKATYGQKQRDAAEKLGVSVRSVQRLVKRWEQEGVAGITQNSRADKGKHRISEFWENFIIKTYKEGNKGSKRMTPKQVVVRMQAKAREIGDEKPPHHRTAGLFHCLQEISGSRKPSFVRFKKFKNAKRENRVSKFLFLTMKQPCLIRVIEARFRRARSQSPVLIGAG